MSALGTPLLVDSVTTIPPFAWIALAAFVVLFLPRQAGHAVAAIATALVGIQAFLIDDGIYAEAAFLGFEAVFLNVDPASRTMAIGVGIIATAAVIYSWGSEASKVQTAFALSYVSSTLGVIYAGDWLSLIFFWELMAVTSTALVWYYGGDAIRAGYRYAIAHGIGGTLLLGAVVVHYVAVGSFLFTAEPGIAAGAAALLAALGIGVNCGFILLHTWIPDTYPRPHIAASVFLSVFTTKTAVLVMYRAFPEGALWLAYLGGSMAVYGVFFALLQYNPRRLLSYHIQAQVGYMLAGIGAAALVTSEPSSFASASGIAHAFNNILYKSLLFMAVGVVIYRTGENDIRNLGGLWKVMPITFAAYLIGALSITAVPGFSGFISKGMVLDAAHDVDTVPFLLGEDLLWWLLIIGGVGTFMSFIKLGYYIFFHGESDIQPKDATTGQIVAMFGAGAVCLYYGIAYGGFLSLLPGSVEWTTDPYSTGHLTEAAGLAIAGFVGFALLKKPLGKLAHVMRDVDTVINPAVFYTGRVFVWGVTEVWAAVDRFVMNTLSTLKRLGSNPEATVRKAGFGTESKPIYLRSDVGRSVFILTTIMFVALVVLLFG
ncbi:Na(+)/H(+) antiporter subunit D [Natronocalculus amylovorans]|uniref:Na(+)/H(+) antiporter subunit D n=1 Tax=Natronocalculus amylovorans TaxID=2917812 RepID=A0AAE3K9K3_9EURY|nr:Na(+)/H(+) antiporter subunit D [Natronocalculus amylovorans]MCL9818427.1 Na(+)/H(+) antiporter subunit D [Natronocalculus amylovorans]